MTNINNTINSCGENTTYTLDNNGTFILKGTGSTEDFIREDGSCRAFSFHDKIKKIVIEEGVTRIGSCFFLMFHNLETVDFPTTLKEIGEYAFWDCTSLKDIQFNKVENIKEGAFQHCISLENIDFGDEIKTIERNAFYGCKKIKTENVIFPHLPVINIHELAFHDSSFDMEEHHNIVNRQTACKSLLKKLEDGLIPELTKRQAIILSIYTNCNFVNKFIFDLQEKFLGEKFFNELDESLELEEFSIIVKKECQKRMQKTIKNIGLHPITIDIVCSLIPELIPVFYSRLSYGVKKRETFRSLMSNPDVFLQTIINKMISDINITDEDIEETIKEILRFEEE